MILPLSESDRRANPAFEKVWKYVTSEALAKDGASRTANEARWSRWRSKSTGRGLVEVVSLAGGAAGADDGSSTCSDGKVVDEDEDEDDGADADAYDGEKGHEVKKKGKDLEETIHEVRVRRIKRDILREVLADVAYRGDDLSGMSTGTKESPGHAQRSSAPDLSGLRDLILFISAYLEVNLNAFPSNLTSAAQRLISDEEDVLSEDISRFKDNIPIIADAVSLRLLELESSLSAISKAASENPDLEDQPKQSLAETLRTQVSHLTHLRTTLLPSQLTVLTSTLQTLLTVQRTLLDKQIQRLEASKHGVISRHEAARVKFLETVATAMELKTRVLVLECRRDIETGEEAVQRRERVREKMGTLEGEEQNVDTRMVTLERVLAEFEAVDPDGGVMAKLGKRYKQVEEEMETVRRDTERLEGRRV